MYIFLLLWVLASTSALPILENRNYLTIRQAEPLVPIFPKKNPGDAPYSQTETVLRSAIQIPPNFSNGQKLAVIMAPGTGVTGTQTYSGNFMKLLATSTKMEAVVLDIPDNLLDDVQVNAEFVAYAMNYVSGISNNAQVGVITWSQGSINMQWALKYWPSTRATVSDFIAVSPDISGTTIADIGGVPITAGGITPLSPALLQQVNTANVIKTLRAGGGDSAIVPTTAIYSNADEVVQPQDNTTNASGFFAQNNGVGASNSLAQSLCPNQPAGGAFTHEGMLYNPLSFALAMDALTNPGPGDPTRLNLTSVCSTALTPGLTDTDKSTTDTTIKTAAGNIVTYGLSSKAVFKEPAIASYAIIPA